MELISDISAQGLEHSAPLTEVIGDSELVALHEVVQSIARQTDSREVLPLIAEKARALTGAACTTIALLDPSRAYLDFVAVAGADPSEIVGQRVSIENALAGHTAATGEIYVAHNLRNTRPLLTSLDPESNFSLGVRSVAVVPIFISGSPAGALIAINRKNDESFLGTDVLRLQLLANATALTLGADRLRRESSQKERERNILFAAVRASSSSLNVQEVLRGVLATVAESIEITVGAVFLLNDERTRLYIAADSGLNDDEREYQLAADEGLPAQAFSSSQPLRVDDAKALDESQILRFSDSRSLLIAPMMARSSAEGLIIVGARRVGAYSAQDANLLSAVASQAAIALENAWLYEDATRRAQEATAIYEMSQSVNATLELDSILSFVADNVLDLLDVDKFALFLRNLHTDRLEIKTSRNITEEAVQNMQPRIGEGIAGWVMEFETPTAVQEVAADHRNRSCPIDQEGVTSLVSVPLQVGDRIIGVLQAMSTRRRLFTVGEIELLYTIANQVATAIYNAQAYEQARQQKEEIRKYVRRVARALGSSSDLTKGAQVIADLAAEMTGADRSILHTLDSAGMVIARAASRFKSAMATSSEPAGPNSPTMWVARRARSLLIEDIAAETRFTLPSYAIKERACGYLGVPLKLGSDTLGVLEVYTKEPRKFSADEMRSLLTFASQASVGLKNALLVEQAGRRLDDLDALAAISRQLYSGSNLQDLCTAALESLCHAARTDIGLIAVFRENDESQLFFRRSDSLVPDSENWSAYDEPLNRLADWVKEYGKLASLPAPDADSADFYALAVPIPSPAGGKPQGALILCRIPPASPFDIHDTQLLKTAASLLATQVR